MTLNHIILDHFVVKSENNGMYADLVDKNLANRGWKLVFMCYFGRLVPLRVYVRTCSPTSGSHISCKWNRRSGIKKRENECLKMKDLLSYKSYVAESLLLKGRIEAS